MKYLSRPSTFAEATAFQDPRDKRVSRFTLQTISGRFALLLLLLAVISGVACAQSGTAKVTASVGPGTPYYTDDVTATVTVTSSSGPVPTGSISGAADGGQQKSVPLVNGAARLNLAFFAPGAHSFVYTYSGDGTYAASSAQTLSFTVSDRPFAPIGGESIFLKGLNPTTNLYNFTAAVDSSDNVYLTDPTTNTLYKADPAGVLTVIPTTGLNLPDGLTLDKSGNIFIADVNNARIVEVTASGQQSVVPITGLVKPVNVAFDPAYKSLYVVDQGNSTVVVYDVAAKTQSSINPGISPINGIAIDPTGNLYLSGGSGQGDIYRRDTAGNVVDLYVGTSDPQGLLLDDKGNLYIASGYGLFELDTQGHLTQLNFQGLGEGVVSGVLLMHSFAMDSRGQIYYPNGQTFRFIPGAGGNSGLVDTQDQANAAPEQNPAYEYLSDFRVYYQAPYQVTLTNLAFAPGNAPFGPTGRNTLGISGSPGLAPFLDILALQNAPILPGPYSTYVTLTTSDGKQYTSIIYGVGRGYEFAIAPGTITSQSPSVSSMGGVAKDANGNIYVSDPAGGQVLEISSTATTKVPFTGLNNPTDVAVDATGAVYVLDSGSSRILRVDNAGNQTVAFDLKQQSALTSLSAFAMDGGADFYLAGNAASGQAAIYYLNSLGTQTLAAGNIALPSAVAVDELGTVYSVEAGGILRHFDLAGNGTELASGLPTPTSIAIDASGTVYVTGEAGSGVTVVSPDGTKAAYPAAQLANASAVAVDNSGNLTVADSTDKQVFTVNRQQGQTYNYDFGNVAVGSTKTTAGSLSNVGNVVSLGYTITPATDPFAWATGSQACVAAEPTADVPLSPGQFCDFTLSFTPTALGNFSDTLYVRDYPSGNQLFPIIATGTATAAAATPSLSFSPASLTFPSTTAGNTSAAQTLTLKNAGSATANITSISLAGANVSAFSLSSACRSTLAANASCTLTVTFSPTAANSTFTASVSAASDDPHSPTVATLAGSSPAGTASPTPVLTPATMNFGNVLIGTVSANQTATLKNTGTAALPVLLFTISGNNPGGFGYTDNCGSSLAAGASCSIVINCDPAIVETLTATFHANFPSPIPQQSIALTCNATAFSAALTPATASFTAASGSTSAAQTFTLANAGSAALAITSVSLSGTDANSFKVSSNTCGSSLAGNSSCTFAVTFSPASVGSFSASLSVVDAVGTQTSILTGTSTAAAAPHAVLTPATSDFGSLTVGTTSAAKAFTLANTGNAALNINLIGIVPANGTGFTISSNTCGNSLAAGSSCTISVTFDPVAAGSATATLSVSDNAAGSAQTSVLSGTGVAPATPTATLTPAAVAFGQVTTGSNASQTLTLKNTGTVALSITARSNLAAPYTLANSTCGNTLAAGADCTYTIAFNPTSTGSATATFSVTDTAGEQSSVLTGTGIAPAFAAATLTPPKLDFGTIPTGTRSATQTITLTSTGTAPLTITGISVTGTSSSAFSSTNNCGSTLAVGSSCAISILFDPTAAGTDSAALTVNDNAAGSPQTTALAGTATTPPPAADFSLTATPASQSVNSGSTAVYKIAVEPLNGDFAQSVSLAASGLPPGATIAFAPTAVTPGSSGSTSTMTIQTATQQASVRAESSRWPLSVGLVSAAILILPFRRRRKLLSSLGCLLLLLTMGGAMSACGGGFALPHTTPAAATYTIAVTGTSGSTSHSTTVTLTVK